ncbi:hypothetical protein [Endozoicomonas montiporae]|uniref:DUF7673 domain-containing protein n=1 Tax=Endozoicomonas montiporae CL-33 TaxID=570277 RepID=A0A142BB38_9GAMM|nr:hypothetical protein [Endozoicomonas montiporae]AMO55964.1 hypothetical protein EZMO1_1821 [Endozoicomonas montiporae CL-33]
MGTQMKQLNQPVTAVQYFNSVAALVKVAQLDTSGSRAAAQVLLSAYNGSEWQLNVTDLCHLDQLNMFHAMTVIQGRASLMREPQEGIENGDDIFMDLWKRWERYNINNRHLRTCRECYGTGEVYANHDDENDYTTKTCPYCGGKGYC